MSKHYARPTFFERAYFHSPFPNFTSGHAVKGFESEVEKEFANIAFEKSINLNSRVYFSKKTLYCEKEILNPIS